MEDILVYKKICYLRQYKNLCISCLQQYKIFVIQDIVLNKDEKTKTNQLVRETMETCSKGRERLTISGDIQDSKFGVGWELHYSFDRTFEGKKPTFHKMVFDKLQYFNIGKIFKALTAHLTTDMLSAMVFRKQFQILYKSSFSNTMYKDNFMVL